MAAFTPHGNISGTHFWPVTRRLNQVYYRMLGMSIEHWLDVITTEESCSTRWKTCTIITLSAASSKPRRWEAGDLPLSFRQLHCPAALPLDKTFRCALSRRLHGPQSPSGHSDSARESKLACLRSLGPVREHDYSPPWSKTSHHFSPRPYQYI